MMFGVVLVGTYTSVFIASPILIYLGVGTGRMGAPEEPETPSLAASAPAPTTPTTPTPPRRVRARR
jgi:preprotein translocase subunit SecF